MTREFPLVRLALAERLLIKHGFDLILFEGSALEAWLASDQILNAKVVDPTIQARSRDLAFPTIWRAPEYTQVFARPFYVASYDLQPGMGSLRSDAVPEFLRAVHAYSKAPKEAFNRWVRVLGRLSDRKSGFPNQPLDKEAQEEILNAISDYELWLPAAVSAVARKHPDSPHAAMLKLTPGFLRAQVKLWSAHQSDPNLRTFKTFQETRDRLGAEMIERITREVSRSHKVIVWAHHVHVFHNTQGLGRHSLGSDLKRLGGESVYTVGTFSDTGETYSLAEQDEIIEGPLRPAQHYGLESQLKLLSTAPCYFADFKNLASHAKDNSWLTKSTTTRHEATGSKQVIPLQDFDAAIFVRTISRPTLPWSK